MKEEVIKLLECFGIDTSKLRLIKHGNYIDIYPKKARFCMSININRSRRRDKTKKIIKDGSVLHIPVTEGIHSQKEVIDYGFISKEMLYPKNAEFLKDTLNIIKAEIKLRK